MSTLARSTTSKADIAIPMSVQTNPAQCARIKLQDMFALGLGEWFLNTLEGVPYVGTILGVKNPNISAIRSLFRSIILQAPGIVSVRELNVNYDPRARKLTYDFVAVDSTGTLIKGGDSPFIVQTPIAGGI
jgi:hypothetical protein